MGYEARMDAESDHVRERAMEMLNDGDFDDDIAEMIKEGRFDWHVLERAVALVKESMGLGNTS